MPEEAPVSEVALVQECLAGNELAWQELFLRYQPGFLRVIRCLLARSLERPAPTRRPAVDENRVEEIAERVWASLCYRDYRRLKGFDAERSSFSTFLALRARNEIDKEGRSHWRRKSPVSVFDLPPPMVQGPELTWEIVSEEFVGRLPGWERQALLQWSLVVPAETLDQPLGPDAVRQALCNIRRRWQLYRAGSDWQQI